MQDQLARLLEKLQTAKDVAEQSRCMEMVVYPLDMAIVEAQEEIEKNATEGNRTAIASTRPFPKLARAPRLTCCCDRASQCISL